MVRLGQRDGPVGRRRLERGQVRGLGGHGHQLLPHLQRLPQEVDCFDLQSERLAVAHPGPGRQHDKRAVALGHGGNEGLDQLGGQRLDRFGSRLGNRTSTHGVAMISRSRSAARNTPATNE